MDWNRLKDKGTLIAIGSKIVLIIQVMAVLLGFKIEDETVKNAVIVFDAFLAVLVLMGIVNDPNPQEEKKTFKLK
ncbi:phage holin [Marinicrinis sediminis]|uniref:Phage holin n=1 Tax=Marinicrinis sediminis TaxID=1652465 RepID=A0ABW5RA08_9BACL